MNDGKNKKFEIDVNIHTMLYSLMNATDFSSLSNRDRQITGIALLNYLCNAENCNPEDLSKKEKDLVERVAGKNIEELQSNL